ncbi:MAG TPA: class I SAM-dependent methyltransferase [Chlorobaculum parvum]|uniref:Class I SAM-dependent methyltransferase n=1 Tax=Chlorobaculum parvum TaxID=274539 RepID=A0A7C5DFE1_9CHLB|nr:class I SAM-dependent methyltransferase [Chlorobaculum parvum]
MSDHQTHSRGNETREWFEEWFDHPLYLKVYQHRNQQEAARCVQTILSLTGLAATNPPASMLDIACGAGRHAVEFARSGLTVTANDLSAFLLNQARDLAKNEKLQITFSRQDMRKVRFDRQFELVTQLFSSFGYFETDQEDRDILANVFSLLRPGGWYVLDLLNPDHLKRNFVPRTERRSGTLQITEERTLSERKVTKRLILTEENGKSHAFTESVRFFTPDEATGLLESEGFIVERMIGDYEGRAFDAATSPRMMLIARKPVGSD